MDIEKLIAAVEASGHEQWRATHDGAWLFPLVPNVDQRWMAEHPELVKLESDARTGALAPFADIAALSFAELPPSRKEDARESFRYAFEAIQEALQYGRPLDETFIEETAAMIHEGWLSRNRARVLDEAAELEAEGSEESIEKSRELREDLVPYARLRDESERQKDRNYVELAIRSLLK